MLSFANQEPYIVAEVNTSHFGNFESAIEAIEVAKIAGCDCIKFQSWSPRSLFTSKYLEENRIQSRMYSKLAIRGDQLAKLAEYACEVGIQFSSTPYSTREVDELCGFTGVPFIKIASMDITNVPLIRHAVETGRPVVVSTGMADLSEIRSAANLFDDQSQLTLLHCTSLYPTPMSLANVRNVELLREQFPECNVGYSDHTYGVSASIIAVALGAVLIEKHFTLDHSRPGFDNAMALGRDELRHFVSALRDGAASMGSRERVLSPEELEQRMKMRRSLHAAVDVPAGTLFDARMVEYKRPGDGLPLDALPSLEGRRVQQPLAAGDALTSANFEVGPQ